MTRTPIGTGTTLTSTPCPRRITAAEEMWQTMIRQVSTDRSNDKHTSLFSKIQQGTTYQSQMPLSRLQIPARRSLKKSWIRASNQAPKLHDKLTMPGTLFMVRMRNRCNGHVSCFGSCKPRCAVLTAEATAVEQGVIRKTHTGVVDVARAMARALIRTSCLTSCQQ